MEYQFKALKETYEASKSAERARGGYEIGQDGVGLARNVVGAIGNGINVYALHKNNRRLNADGSMLSTIAATGIITLPWTALISAKVARTKAVVPSESQVTSTELRQAYEAFGKIAPVKDPEDLKICRVLQDVITRQMRIRELKDAGMSKIEVRELVRNDLYGATKLAQTTMGIIVNERRPRGATADNRVNAAGNTIYTSGQMVNIAKLVHDRLVDELELKKQKRQGEDICSLASKNQIQLQQALQSGQP